MSVVAKRASVWWRKGAGGVIALALWMLQQRRDGDSDRLLTPISVIMPDAHGRRRRFPEDYDLFA
jgi:hypothetical protein